MAKFTYQMIRFAKILLGHALISATFWLWMGIVALGLGFKGRQAWSVWDHIQSSVVPPLALALMFPGRLVIDVYPEADLVLVWLGNSALWAACLTFITFIASKRAA